MIFNKKAQVFLMLSILTVTPILAMSFSSNINKPLLYTVLLNNVQLDFNNWYNDLYIEQFDFLNASYIHDLMINDSKLTLNVSISGYNHIPENYTFYDNFTEDEEWINGTKGIYGVLDIPSSVCLSDFHYNLGDLKSVNVNVTMNTSYSDFALFFVITDPTGLNFTYICKYQFYIYTLEPNVTESQLDLEFVAWIDNNSESEINSHNLKLNNSWDFLQFDLDKSNSMMNWENISLIAFGFKWDNGTSIDQNISVYIDHLSLCKPIPYLADNGTFVSQWIYPPFENGEWTYLTCITDNESLTNVSISQDNITWYSLNWSSMAGDNASDNLILLGLNNSMPILFRINLTRGSSPNIDSILITYREITEKISIYLILPIFPTQESPVPWIITAMFFILIIVTQISYFSIRRIMRIRKTRIRKIRFKIK
jgi:hypothetical protein